MIASLGWFFIVMGYYRFACMTCINRTCTDAKVRVFDHKEDNITSAKWRKSNGGYEAMAQKSIMH